MAVNKEMLCLDCMHLSGNNPEHSERASLLNTADVFSSVLLM